MVASRGTTEPRSANEPGIAVYLIDCSSFIATSMNSPAVVFIPGQIQPMSEATQHDLNTIYLHHALLLCCPSTKLGFHAELLNLRSVLPYAAHQLWPLDTGPGDSFRSLHVNLRHLY